MNQTDSGLPGAEVKNSPSIEPETPPITTVADYGKSAKGKGCWHCVARGAGILAALMLALLVVLALVGIAATASILAPGPLAGDRTLVIPRGSSVIEIATMLDNAEAIRGQWSFRLASRVIAADNLQAGEYAFKAGQSVADMVMDMRDGRSVVRMFTIVEGQTAHDVVAALRGEQAFSGDIANVPAEGSMLPETYRYSYGDERSGIVSRASKGHEELLARLWEEREKDIPVKTPHEALVIASIIEKETGNNAMERARIAGVFYNRMRKGMRLQSDPTVIYAITKGERELGRSLKHEDLAFKSPYNTYASDGLPPAPICNPGKAAIEAAMHPEKHDYLYFVADGSGGHAFSSTLSGHNQNVEKWISVSDEVPLLPPVKPKPAKTGAKRRHK